MLRRECQNSTSVELKKLTGDPNYSDADRILGRVSLLQAQSVADACYDAQPSDKPPAAPRRPAAPSKPSGPANDLAIREAFQGLVYAPYTSTRSYSYESTTLLSVILLGAAVVCFWRAAAN